MWSERGIRAWGEGWWTTPMTVGDQVGRIVGAPAGSTVMHQNVAIAEAVVLSCFFPIAPERNRVVYERGNFPSVRYLYQAQPGLEVRGLRGRRGDRRRDRRADAARADQPRPLQDGGDPGRRPDRAACPRGRRARDPRLLPVGGDRAGRRGRARRRLRRRRLRQVALRRAGNGWLYVRPELAECCDPDLHGVAGARGALRLRGGDALRIRRGAAVPHRHPERAGPLRGDRRLRPDRGDRRRTDPRQLAPTDTASDRPRRRGGFRGVEPARARATRRGP